MQNAQWIYKTMADAVSAEERKASVVVVSETLFVSAVLVSGMGTGPLAAVVSDPGNRIVNLVLLVLFAVFAAASLACACVALSKKPGGKWGSLVSVDGVLQFSDAAEYVSESDKYQEKADDISAQSYELAVAAKAKRRFSALALWLSAASVVTGVAFSAVYFCAM